ncbi:DUF4190 domain-containing protein [Kitasatospora sp. NPDC056327]|uniref:DUF4190 domain-containing protein n=1 Tax=Kitasatospora sp. NPDC056327 TaxID=3345785 RepID=UPI0035DEC5C9
MSKPESDDASPLPVPERVGLTKPAAEPASASQVEPAPAAGPQDGPGTVGAAEPAPVPDAVPPADVPAADIPAADAVAPDPAPAVAPAPVGPPVPPAAPVPDALSAPAPDPWAAPAHDAGPAAPPAPDPWATPTGVQQPPFDPGPPRATGWAAVTPGAQSGFHAGFPYPPAPTTTNGFSIAALVTGLLCMWPLTLAFSIVALVQIPKRNEKGRGMAVTGLVLGVLGAIATLIGFIGLAAIGLEEERYADAPLGPRDSVAVNDLREGDCFDQPPFSPGRDPESASVYWVRVVPCGEPHHGEVAGVTSLAGRGADYPTASEIARDAARLCNPVRADYALDSWLVPEGMDGYYYYPGRSAWATGDRRVTCTFQDEKRPHAGSVRTDRTKLTQAQRTYLDAVRAYDEALDAEPEGDVDGSPAEYRAWARTMAAASRREVAELSANGVDWPAGARARLIELGAIKLDAANAWDAAAKAVDPATIEREAQKAQALSAKGGRLAVDIRRELGLSTGEVASDIRV